MDRQEVVKFLGLMAEHFPSFQFSEDTASAWLMVLADHSSEDVLDVYKSFLKYANSAFAPSASQMAHDLDTKRIMSGGFLESFYNRGKTNE